MSHPVPAYFTIKMLSERWNKMENDIEAYLREDALYASVNLQPNYLLCQADDINETPVWQGGVFEIVDYKNIEWNNNGDCDFGKKKVGLRKFGSDPLRYKEEWIKSGKLRGLRYMWRLNAYGHEVYRPLSELIINKRNIFIELTEVRSYEEEHGIGSGGTGTAENIKEREPAPKTAAEYVEECRRNGICDEIIAAKLHEGHYKISHINVARLLGFGADLQEGQRDAMKQRGKRACDKGKRLLIEASKIDKI